MELQPVGKPEPQAGKGAPARARLYANGALIGEGEVPLTLPLTIGIVGGLVVGRSLPSRVSTRYEPPFAFDGTLHKVVVDVSGKKIEDHQTRAATAMARQ